MAPNGQKSSSEPGSGTATPKNNGKKEVKILMLHGYTQSGSLFRAKTRALEKLLQKALAPHSLSPTFFYPTAPNRLRPRDIPGYEPTPGAGGASDGDDDEHGTASDAWAWYRKDEASGAYRFFAEGMKALAAEMAEHGPVDGVVGFSQGGAMAAMLAALLEPGRQPPPSPDGAQAAYDFSFLPALRAANGHRPLRFAVSYSGFFAPPTELAWLYEPRIATPTLHFIGSLDTVVVEGRSRGLVARCEDPVVVMHPGGHYVPVSKEWVLPLVGFIKQYGGGETAEEEATGSSDEG